MCCSAWSHNMGPEQVTRSIAGTVDVDVAAAGVGVGGGCQARRQPRAVN